MVCAQDYSLLKHSLRFKQNAHLDDNWMEAILGVGPMFAQSCDCAAARGGMGGLLLLLLLLLKTPVNVLVILEPLGWETDSLKKHLSTLRSSEWFTAYLDICKELLHLETRTLSLSPPAYLLAVVNPWECSVTLSHLEGIQGGATSCHLLPQGFTPPSSYLLSYLIFLSPSSHSWDLATPRSFWPSDLMCLAHQLDTSIHVTGACQPAHHWATTHKGDEVSDKSTTEREKCVSLWIIKPSKAVFSD